MAKNSKTKTAKTALTEKEQRLREWVNSDPTAAPSKGQVFAFLMPSKGGLNTGALRATEAAEKLEALGLPCWTRKGLAQMNDAIRADKARREAGQAWLTGLLAAKEAPSKGVEVPEEEAPQEERLAALKAQVCRLEAENARLRAEGGKPDDIPPGMVFVNGHLRRKR